MLLFCVCSGVVSSVVSNVRLSYLFYELCCMVFFFLFGECR